MTRNRYKWETRGKAHERNMVKGEKYRFTILTTRLIRMEFSDEGTFEDRATQSFFYRDFEKNEYSVEREAGVLTIETSELLLTYVENSSFSAETLSICLKSFPGSQWRFGQTTEQLKGTACTLDNTNGAVALEDGVISRDGYTVIDDSTRMVLTEEGWFDVRKEGIMDLYFFGYGHDYLACLQDFYRLTGRPPLLPDYALGNWWSRFHAYTQEEYCGLIERFEEEEIPFSVAVVDMDWHTQEEAPESRMEDARYIPGWTGYSWNTKLFPDYKGFLQFLKEHNLKTALNLHPAQGIGCSEAMYEEMAAACGVDPKSRKLIKFDCLDPEFMEHYFDILHHPYEEDGVDFWWMDWQQGTDYWWIHDEEHQASPLEKMDPLWLLNHLHILDISRNGKRPMFFSRYSGIGSHRYPVGFSGDTVITWESLNFQPYFTANASNVGYGWWSHDIGGHMQGYRDDELVVRWMQLGVFSPINRLHSSSNPFQGKEPWNLMPQMEQTAKEWLRLRHRLFPYLYTMNYRHHTELVPLVLPMYYSYPEKEAAYHCPNQYWFGSELMVSPVTEKNDTCSLLGKTKVWLPEGVWIDVFNGNVYRGEGKIEVYRSLEQMPVFARAGAIVPMQSFEGNNHLGRKENMELLVFAGADNQFTLYEDEGDYSNYQEGVFAKTRMEFSWGNEAVLKIHPVTGEASLLPERRNWTVKLVGVKKPEQVTIVEENGAVREAKICAGDMADRSASGYDMAYDEHTATAVLSLPKVDITKGVTIYYRSEGELLYDNVNVRDRIFEILLHAQMSYYAKSAIWNHIQDGNHVGFNDVCTALEYRSLLGAIEELLALE